MKTNKTKILVALFIVLSILMSMATLTVYASDTQTVVEEHNFETNGKESAFFSITGNLSTSKGTVTYNGVTISQCLKMESSTSITFEAPAAGTLTLVFVEINKGVKIDGSKIVSDTNGIVTKDLEAGSHTITKGDTMNLFYMSFSYSVASDAHVHDYVEVKDAAVAPTCTEAGSKTYTCSKDGCPEPTITEPVSALGHTLSFVTTAPTAEADGSTVAKCSVCETETNYGATKVMTPGTYVLDAADLAGISAGDFKDGDVKVVNSVFAAHLSDKYKTEEKACAFDDADYASATHRFNFGGKTEYKANGMVKNAIEITTTGLTTIKVYWTGGDKDRRIGIYTLTPATEDTAATFTTVCESENSAAKDDKTLGYIYESIQLDPGTYYIGNVVNQNYIYRIEVLVECEEHVGGTATCTELAKCDACGESYGKLADHAYVEGVCSACGAEDPNYVPPHVNSLVVGDTNKIVITGEKLNDYGYPIEWVAFAAGENAHYAFAGEGVTIFIFDANLNLLCGGTGAANLEAGYYLICIGGYAAGEYNVAVTKNAWDNTLALGANKVYVDGSILNAYELPITWATFTVTEKANYSFVCAEAGALAFIFDSTGAMVCNGTGVADLEPGTYAICVGGGVVGMFNVTVTKTEIAGGGDGPDTGLPKIQLGDNTITIDGSVTNLTGTAIAWLEFVVEEAGTYIFSSSDLKCYVYTEMNLMNYEACVCGFTGIATLEPGTYYICAGNQDARGEFIVNVTLNKGEAPHKNEVKLGDNHYVVTDALLGLEDPHEWLPITITEPGTYVIKGGAPLTIFFFTVPGTLNELSPYGWNVDLNTGAFVTEFEVELDEAGSYWMGFRYDFIGEQREFDFTISLKPHEHEFVDGKCECGEEDPNYVPPHEHEFVNGKCECGEEDPNYVEPKPEDPKPEDPKPADPKPEEPAEKSFFEKIWETILGIFNQIVDFFKGLIANKK